VGPALRGAFEFGWQTKTFIFWGFGSGEREVSKAVTTVASLCVWALSPLDLISFNPTPTCEVFHISMEGKWFEKSDKNFE
jgi:hypothetical protein